MMIHVEKCTTLNFLLLIIIVALLLHKVTSTTYFVIPDDHSSHYMYTNTFSLQHYLNNTSKYFVSHNQFHFMQGQYYINNDLVIKDVDNFTITGIGQCTIICTSPASIVIMNANNTEIININLINCTKNHKVNFNITSFRLFSKVTDYYTSLLLYNSSSVIIYNMNIIATVNTSFIGILIVNVKDQSKIINVKVRLKAFNCSTFNKHLIKINGIRVIVHFYDRKSPFNSVTIDNFYFKNYKSCENHDHLSCVIVTLFLGNDNDDNARNIYRLKILNSAFSNLTNSSVICSYGVIKERHKVEKIYRRITIKNCTFSDNTGNSQLNMFNIVLINLLQYVSSVFNIITQSYGHYIIQFEACTFTRNVDMKALIYIKLPSTDVTIGYIAILKCKISDNKNVTFIKVEQPTQIRYDKIIYILLTVVNVSSNKHHYGDSLISITNGYLRLKSLFFIQNDYYDNVLNFQSSMLYVKYYNEISSNYARHIIKEQGNSFIFIHYLATINISQNIVYKVFKQVINFEKHVIPVCPIQFSISNSELKSLHFSEVNCTLLLSNNMEMISRILPTDIISYMNNKCKWLEGTFYQKINVNVSIAYHKIVRWNNTFVNETVKRLVPLSVCPCLSNDNYNCYVANVYEAFPGQVLNINLIVSSRWSELSSTIIAANTKDDDCSILDSYQLSQTHANNGCNRYSYTIWPKNDLITECKLFIGLNEMPEMFYVQIKPCPMGFTLQNDKKACYCDPLLNNDRLFITSCNINDRTILRPANSWISAVTANNSHSYTVSSQCPFDYCLPHSTHLNLSNPDTQCQFERSGIVCGECQQGLSTVFGSSHCKQCSNLYLLLSIPIAIAGVVLVIMLFTFNLTVTNGIINTLIFYVNIISINYSQFCYDSNSPDCTILSLLNLDLGIETCFYDGMDGYTKMWLQLVFPSYLMTISFTLIIGSRYSSKLQRLTANRVLKVLATLFLLSYTKILLAVCQVLFFFSHVTHLPSKHTTLFWSVDSGVELFGVKFFILYTICLIVFIILLIFNTFLLFPRTLSHWKFINYFKPLLDAYFGPYKSKYTFWTGLQLLIRLSFFGLSALSRNVSLFSGTVLVVIVHCTHGTLHPFISKYKNFQESLVLLNISAVYVTALYNEYENSKYKLLIIRLLIISVLVYFIVLLSCHCIMSMYGDIIKEKSNKMKQILMKKITRKEKFSESLHLEQLNSKIPDVAFDYTEFIEPLVALD